MARLAGHAIIRMSVCLLTLRFIWVEPMQLNRPLLLNRILQPKQGLRVIATTVVCSMLLFGCGEIKSATEYLISGNEAFQRNDYKQAEIEYKKAIHLEPNSSTALNNLGVVLNELGKYDDAVAILTRAVKIDPKNVIARYTLAQALTKSGKYAEAIVEAKQAVELGNSDLGGHRALAQAALLKAKKDKDSEDLKLAIAEYHVILQVDPDDDQAHHNLGDALAMQNDKDGAITEQKKAVELNEDNLAAHKSLANLLHEKGDNEGAQKQLDIIIKKNPSDTEARTLRGSL